MILCFLCGRPHLCSFIVRAELLFCERKVSAFYDNKTFTQCCETHLLLIRQLVASISCSGHYNPENLSCILLWNILWNWKESLCNKGPCDLGSNGIRQNEGKTSLWRQCIPNQNIRLWNFAYVLFASTVLTSTQYFMHTCIPCTDNRFSITLFANPSERKIMLASSMIYLLKEVMLLMPIKLPEISVVFLAFSERRHLRATFKTNFTGITSTWVWWKFHFIVNTNIFKGKWFLFVTCVR